MEPLLSTRSAARVAARAASTRRGYPFVARERRRARRSRLEPEDGWAGAVVPAVERPRAPAFELCRVLRKPRRPGAACCSSLIVDRPARSSSSFREDLFDDFMRRRRRHRRARRLGSRTCSGGPGRGKQHDLIVYGPLALNLETYQAAIERPTARPDLHGVRAAALPRRPPGQGLHAEVLLSRVWGYEYFGGARTVDVHVRRLRAKLGEEHAHLIDTVRSVGYRFGTVRWLPTALR